MTEYLVFLSDDLNHDANLVKTIMDKTLSHLQLRVAGLEKVVVFSDGCAAQYKSKMPFYHLSTTSAPEVSRAYFGSRHGKSPCDACRGVIKTAVDEDIMAREVIVQNAEAMHTHCVNNYTIPPPPAAEIPPPTCVHT